MGPPEVIKARPVRSMNHSVSDFLSGNIQPVYCAETFSSKCSLISTGEAIGRLLERISPFSQQGLRPAVLEVSRGLQIACFLTISL